MNSVIGVPRLSVNRSIYLHVARYFSTLKYASGFCQTEIGRPRWKIYKLYNYTGGGDSRSGTKISRSPVDAFNDGGMTFYRVSLSAIVSPRESRAWEISCSAGDLTTRCKHETLADNNSSPAWIFPSLPPSRQRRGRQRRNTLLFPRNCSSNDKLLPRRWNPGNTIFLSRNEERTAANKWQRGPKLMLERLFQALSMRILTSRYRISSMNPLELLYRSFSRDNFPFLSATMFYRAKRLKYGRNLGKRLTIIPLTKRTRYTSLLLFSSSFHIRPDAKKTSLPISDRACALFQVPCPCFTMRFERTLDPLIQHPLFLEIRGSLVEVESLQNP